MLASEVLEFEEDILDAFVDVGTTDSVPNLTWMKQKYALHDKLYLQEINKYFDLYEINVLVTTFIPKDEKTALGLDDSIETKLYVVNKSFSDVIKVGGTEEETIIPKEEDRVKYNGVVFEVAKLRSIHLGGRSFLWIVYLKQATFSAQDEIFRETREPLFQINASLGIVSVNETGVNAALYYGNPAYYMGNVSGAFTITSVNNVILIAANTIACGALVTINVAIPEGVYSTVTLVPVLQAAVDASVSGVFVMYANNTFVGVKTALIGALATLEIGSISGNVYNVLGWSVKTSLGSVRTYLDDPAYSDGDPVYEC